MKTFPLLFVFALLASAGVPASAQILAAFAYDSDTGTSQGVLGETFINADNPPDPSQPGGPRPDYTVTSNGISLTVSNYLGEQPRTGFPFPDDSANIAPFQGVVFGSGNPGVDFMDFTIGGLTAGKSFKVVVYSGDGGGGTGSEPTDITLGGVTAMLNAGKESTSFIPAGQTGANYLEEFVTANGSGDITFTATPDAAGDSYDFVDGVTIAEAPEPATWLMLGAGLLALVQVRRVLRLS